MRNSQSAAVFGSGRFGGPDCSKESLHVAAGQDQFIRDHALEYKINESLVLGQV